MKWICVILALAMLLSVFLTGCQDSEEMIKDKYLAAVRRLQDDETVHFSCIIDFTTANETQQIVEMYVWIDGENVYAETMQQNKCVSQLLNYNGLQYEKTVYSGGWSAANEDSNVEYLSNILRENAEIISWTDTVDGCSVITDAPWLANRTMGEYEYDSALVTYHISEDGFLLEVTVEANMILEGEENLHYKESWNFFEISDDVVAEKIESEYDAMNPA